MPILTAMRSAFVRGLVILVSSVAPGLGLAQPAIAPPSISPDVVFSASGGVSKGSYQGGVDWTISEFLRRQRIDELRSILLIEHDTRFNLTSATGASAGNVNALFVALGWCSSALERASWSDQRRDNSQAHAAEIAAEDSLFWQAWIPTGLTELDHGWKREGLTPPAAPASESPEPAAFSRRLFQEAHKPAVRDFMTRAVPWAGATGQGCRIPVGMTLTKLSPVDVPLRDDVGRASVQRFASVFHVVSRQPQASSPEDPRLDFAPPSDLKDSASLGALALVPSLDDQSPQSFGRRLDDVFDVVLTSSSFPIAFAPRTLCYQPGGLIKWDSSAPLPCDAFADGGVFDNNPIGLAYRLHERTGGAPRLRGLHVAYSSPGHYRGALLAARPPKFNETDQHGLGSAAQLLAGAFQAARDYELQAFARMLARDREMDPASSDRIALRLSSRSTPIFGETLASFGAFLGRPLREYDFHAGVYDGLEFVARHFVCADRPEGTARETCTAQKHALLIQRNALHLSPEGERVALWLLARERTRVSVAAPPESDPKMYLMYRLHQSLDGGLDVGLPDEPCAKRADVVQAAICGGGLEAPLRYLDTHHASVVAAARSLKSICAMISVALRHCATDDGFVNLLEQADRHIYDAADRALGAIDRAEVMLQRLSPTAPNYDLPLSAASALFNAQTLRYRRGVEVNASTSRRLWRTHKLASIASLVVPNYVQTIRLREINNDATVLGWQPFTIGVGNAMYLSNVAEWSLQDARWNAWSVAQSVGAYVRWPLTISSIEGGVGYVQGTRRSPLFDDSGWRVRLSARGLGEKVQLTVWTLPLNNERWHRSLGIGMGVSDVNGLFHWLIRLGS